MTPADFPEANKFFVAPSGYTEHQVVTIPGYKGDVARGSCEGAPMCVVAYELSAEDLARLLETRTVFVTMLGGLAPHFLSLSFAEATNVA